MIPDDGTEVVVEADTTQQKVAVTITPTQEATDTTLRVDEKDAQGTIVQSWELDGNGDGTGWITVEAGHTVEVTDTDSEVDTEKGHVTVDMA